MFRALVTWIALGVGPRIGRTLLVQAMGALLVFGLATNLVADLAGALHRDRIAHTLAMLAPCVGAFAARGSLRRTLDPRALVALRRQPVRTMPFAACLLVCAAVLAWPWPLLMGLHVEADASSVAAAWAAGALALAGVSSARRAHVALGWASLPVAVAGLSHTLSGAAALALVAAVARPAVRALRRTPVLRSSRARPVHRHPRTPFGAQLAIDAAVLRADACRWLVPTVVPAVAAGYAIVLVCQGACGASCTDIAALVIVSLCALPAAACLRASWATRPCCCSTSRGRRSMPTGRRRSVR